MLERYFRAGLIRFFYLIQFQEPLPSVINVSLNNAGSIPLTVSAMHFSGNTSPLRDLASLSSSIEMCSSLYQQRINQQVFVLILTDLRK